MKPKAKIAGTLGPACDKVSILLKMMNAGMDVARLNFSHGTVPDHEARVARLRRAAGQCGKPVALLADLQGPRFRVGRLPEEGVLLEEGESVTLLAGRETTGPGKIPVAYPALARDVVRGGKILLDDGNLRLRVRSVRGAEVRCEVERGGVLTSRKGINLPGAELSVPTLTVKDRRDLQTAVDLGADWLAISFVRSGRDVRTARRLLEKAGSDMPVMAKIERPAADQGGTLRFQNNPAHHLDRLHRVLSGGGFGGQEKGIASVHHRVGHIAGFRPCWPGRMAHGVEHLCGGHHRLPGLVRHFDHPFLENRHLFRR